MTDKKPDAKRKAAFRKARKAEGGKRVEVTLTASQSLKLDLLASEAGKPRSTVIAELIEGAATAVVP